MTAVSWCQFWVLISVYLGDQFWGLLFCLCINDPTDFCKEADIQMYADKTEKQIKTVRKIQKQQQQKG